MKGKRTCQHSDTPLSSAPYSARSLALTLSATRRSPQLPNARRRTPRERFTDSPRTARRSRVAPRTRRTLKRTTGFGRSHDETLLLRRARLLPAGARMTLRLVWAPPSQHAAVWKNPPEVLICALQPKQIETWRKINRWADNIDMIIFTDGDPPRDVRMAFACQAFAPITGEVPHIVVNAPPEAVPALRRIEVTEALPAGRYLRAVRAVADTLQGVRTAWIQPESDHSIGAVAVAQRLGICVGFSARPMIDSIGAQAAARFGVNVQTLGSIKGMGGLES